VLIELFSPSVTAEALRAKIDRKSAISLQRGQFDPKFQVEGVTPTNHFCTDSHRSMNALQLCRRRFLHKNFVADFLQAKCDFKRKMVVLRFWAPFRGLGPTYDNHLRLIRKLVGDFWLVLIELVSLGVTTEVLRAIIDWKSAISLQRGPVDPKFQVEAVAPASHSFSQKTRLIVLSYGVKIWTDFFFFYDNSRVWRTDGRTDWILIAWPRVHSMQRGKIVSCFVYMQQTELFRPGMQAIPVSFFLSVRDVSYRSVSSKVLFLKI